MENNLIVQNNGLILNNKYEQPVHSVEEGIQRIREIKKDYETIMEAVTERKFYLEGKTLFEMRKLTLSNGKGGFEKARTELGYSKNQAYSLIKKYEIFEKITFLDEESEISENIDLLSQSETFELSKLDIKLQKAILESDNAKAELKKLREELKKAQDEKLDIVDEKLELEETIEKLKEELNIRMAGANKEESELEEAIRVMEQEISVLSKQLNERPVQEKIVEKIVNNDVIVEVEKIVPPLDYENSKRMNDEYLKQLEEKNKEIATAKEKLKEVDILKKELREKIKEAEAKGDKFLNQTINMLKSKKTEERLLDSLGSSRTDFEEVAGNLRDLLYAVESKELEYHKGIVFLIDKFEKKYSWITEIFIMLERVKRNNNLNAEVIVDAESEF